MAESTSDAQAPLPNSAADWEGHFNHSLDLLCIAGLDGYLKQVNPSWSRVLGWSRAELLAKPVVDFMHPEDRDNEHKTSRFSAEASTLFGLQHENVVRVLAGQPRIVLRNARAGGRMT